MGTIAQNGIIREMTAEEQAKFDAITSSHTEITLTEFDRHLAGLRNKRNQLLTETDWVVLPDSPIADKTAWETYRTQLRDITNGLTTVEQVEAVVFPTKPN